MSPDTDKNHQPSEKLPDTLERLDLAMKVKNEGIWDWDLVTNRVVFDDRYYTMAGYMPKEFEQTFSAWAERVHPDDRPDVENEIQAYLSGEKEHYDVTFRFKHKDGTWIWIQGRGKVVTRGEDGRPLRLIGTHTDITEKKEAEEELLALKQFNEDIIQNINEGIVICNNDGEIIFANQALQSILGYKAEETVGMQWKSIVMPADHRIVEEANERRIKGITDRYELMLKDKYNNPVPARVSGSPYRDSKNNEIIGTLAVLADIKDLKKAEEALRESEKRYREILETTEEGFYEVDLKGNIIDCNRAATNMLGFQEREIVGKSYKSLCKDFDAVYREFNQAFTSGKPKFSVIMEMIRKDGSIATADLSVSLTYDQNGIINGFRGMGRDISERIKLQKHLKHLSLHDQLTGLYNRRYFENEIKRLDKSREHPIAVISADLDGLKLVNDTLGHGEGDRYLQAGADLLKSTLRASDVLARVGGDEFALLLPRTGKKEARLLINRIRKQVEKYKTTQKELPLSISLGLAVSEKPDHHLEETFRSADNDMYNNKLQQGKKARKEIVSSLLSNLFELGNLAEGDRKQVQELAVRMGLALKLESSRMAGLELLSQVYDLGKVGLPENLLHRSMLTKKDELTEAEREAIYRHPETGYRIASASPELAGIAELVLKHHENYDGSGYPLGLKGEEIPLENRILSIAISYSAMTNHRSYADMKTNEGALNELKRCAGSQFDPQLVELFLSIIEEVSGGLSQGRGC